MGKWWPTRQFTVICSVAEANAVQSRARAMDETSTPQLEFRRALAMKMLNNNIRVDGVTVGAPTVTPSTLMLLFNIFIARARRNSSCGVEVSSIARARDCTAFASATEQMKVNCHVGHHFVCHTCSRPMGSCLRLLTSSTQGPH